MAAKEYHVLDAPRDMRKSAEMTFFLGESVKRQVDRDIILAGDTTGARSVRYAQCR